MTPDGFDILYEDGPMLLVCKPGGVLTQAVPGIDSLESRIKQFLKQRDNKTGNVYLAVPHRLDRPVSGAMVFAKNVRAARRISEQFEGRLVDKKYWALVEGIVDEDEGTWTDYVRKVSGEARSEIVTKESRDGRVAILHYKIIQRIESATWLEIELETGRTHQIRLQCASRGHPVIGDELYGSKVAFGPAVDDVRKRCIALHARSLQLRHPKTKELVGATAPLTYDWQTAGFDLADVDLTD